MEGELWLKVLAGLAAGKNEMVGGFGRAQVVDVQGPVRVQHFRESQLDIVSANSADPQPRQGAHVLAEVEDVNPG